VNIVEMLPHCLGRNMLSQTHV